MKLFSKLYEWTIQWAKHRFAPWVLSVLTFAESVFFPIPPDVLLAPMVLSKPDKAWHYATITTIASVLGGAVGFWLGAWLFEPIIQPLITSFNYQSKFDTIVSWFDQYGIWVVFLAGFTPIPYKLFTVSAGFLNMMFIPFILISAISRGMRFFLVAGLVAWGGPKVEDKLKQWIDIIGWTVVFLAIMAYLYMQN